MIGVQLPLRRMSGLAVGALLGLTTVLVVGSPASAHKAEVSGDAVCGANGQYEITWTVHNKQPKKDATLTKVQPDPDSAVEGIEVGSVVPQKSSGMNGTLDGHQRVDGTATRATLTVDLAWLDPKGGDNTVTGSATGEVELAGTCAPKPCVSAAEAKFAHTFSGRNGKASVQLAEGQELCEGQSQDFTLVSYFAPKPDFAVPQFMHDFDTDKIQGDVRRIELGVALPNCYTQVDLIFGGQSEIIDPLVEGGKRYGNKILGSNGAPGNRSKGPRGGWNGGDKSCTEPKAAFVSDCDGSVTVNLSNTGKYPATFEIKTADGFNQTVTVAPGGAESVRISPDAVGPIVVTSEGKEIARGSWTRPKDCAPPTVVGKVDCDNLTVTVKNPAGNVPAKAKVTYGTQSKEVTVAAGKAEKVTFPLSSAKKATVTFEELDLSFTSPVPARPANCAGGGGGLPVTGTAVGGWLAAAGLLVGSGAGLYLITRRRRIRFTA